MSARVHRVAPEVTEGSAVRDAAETIRRGGLVAIPTETVYGIATNGTNPAARARLAALKGRDPAKPLTYHMPSALAALDLADDIPARALPLMRRFWPGPLTLVLPSGKGSVGLRVPAHALARAVLERAAVPVVASSANASGERPLTEGAAVISQFGNDLDVILDAGPSRIGESSTVVKVTESGYTILRVGMVSTDMIERNITTSVLFVCTGNTCRSPMTETLFRARLADVLAIAPATLASAGFEIGSAGTGAGYGESASSAAAAVMGERGLDLSRHASRPVDTAMVERATVIYALAPSHLQALAGRWPQHAGKMHPLDEDGVLDPIGGSIETYRACSAHIADRLGIVIDHLFGDDLGRVLLARRATRARAPVSR